jgi:predicted O-linked N-acetylglucosamine transferase (SPINDLY family)
LRQIDARTTQLWRKALEAAPQAVLLLRGRDMAPGANVARLIDRFGRDLAARIDVIDASDAADFYRQVDVALAPVRGSSARMAAEALACGVPVVALGDGGPWQPYPALLRALGLGAMTTPTADAYVALAASLATSAEKRSDAADAVSPVAAAGEAGAAAIASAIEQAARKTLGKAAA